MTSSFQKYSLILFCFVLFFLVFSQSPQHNMQLVVNYQKRKKKILHLASPFQTGPILELGEVARAPLLFSPSVKEQAWKVLLIIV